MNTSCDIGGWTCRHLATSRPDPVANALVDLPERRNVETEEE